MVTQKKTEKKAPKASISPRISDAQREALLVAWSPEYCLEINDYWYDISDGPRPRTVRGLLKRRLIRSEDEGSESFAITPAGEAALGGVYARKPGSPKGALRGALRALVPWLDEDDIIVNRRNIPRLADDDGQRADYTGVIGAAVSQHEGPVWGAVAAMATAAGFPMEAGFEHMGVIPFLPIEEVE